MQFNPPSYLLIADNSITPPNFTILKTTEENWFLEFLEI
jgi:hypothetical protein